MDTKRHLTIGGSYTEKMENDQKLLMIGFCKCAACGYTDNKFNWHTYFRCPECGCKEYVKEDINGQTRFKSSDEENVGEDGHDKSDDIFLVNYVSYY